MRIQLQDGKLYETVDGERFRVKEDRAKGHFTCEACGKAWTRDGMPLKGTQQLAYVGSWLVREVPEVRWVSVHDIDDHGVFKFKGVHSYKQVTREQAQRMAPNYTPPGAKERNIASTQLWHGAQSQLVERDGKRFVRIVTSQGKTVDVEL